MEGAAFCSYWNRHSWYIFAFSVCNTSTKTTTYGLRGYFIYHNICCSGCKSSDSLWTHICSTLGFSVHHYLPDFAQTHVHWVSDAIQPSHPLSSSFPLAITPHKTALVKKSTSAQKKYSSEPMLIFLVSHHSETGDLTEGGNSLLQTQLQHQIGGNILL